MTAVCSGAWGQQELQQLEPPVLKVSGLHAAGLQPWWAASPFTVQWVMFQ